MIVCHFQASASSVSLALCAMRTHPGETVTACIITVRDLLLPTNNSKFQYSISTRQLCFTCINSFTFHSSVEEGYYHHHYTVEKLRHKEIALLVGIAMQADSRGYAYYIASQHCNFPENTENT